MPGRNGELALAEAALARCRLRTASDFMEVGRLRHGFIRLRIHASYYDVVTKQYRQVPGAKILRVGISSVANVLEYLSDLKEFTKNWLPVVERERRLPTTGSNVRIQSPEALRDPFRR